MIDPAPPNIYDSKLNNTDDRCLIFISTKRSSDEVVLRNPTEPDATGMNTSEKYCNP